MTDRPATNPSRQRVLEQYDNELLKIGVGAIGPYFLDRIAELDSIDPGWAQIFLQLQAGIHRRTILDPKTRSLCAVGENTVLSNDAGVRLHTSSALNAGATVEEVTEVILQTCIINGFPAALRALGIFRQMLELRQEDHKE